MEDMGASYCVILRDPELRRGLLSETQRVQRRRHVRLPLRIGVARLLRELAARLDMGHGTGEVQQRFPVG